MSHVSKFLCRIEASQNSLPPLPRGRLRRSASLHDTIPAPPVSSLSAPVSCSQTGPARPDMALSTPASPHCNSRAVRSTAYATLWPVVCSAFLATSFPDTPNVDKQPLPADTLVAPASPQPLPMEVLTKDSSHSNPAEVVPTSVDMPPSQSDEQPPHTASSPRVLILPALPPALDALLSRTAQTPPSSAPLAHPPTASSPADPLHTCDVIPLCITRPTPASNQLRGTAFARMPTASHRCLHGNTTPTRTTPLDPPGHMQ